MPSRSCLFRLLFFESRFFKYCHCNGNKTQYLKISHYDKKTELGAEERIPVFFSESPPLRAVISSDQVKISSTSKTRDMSYI